MPDSISLLVNRLSVHIEDECKRGESFQTTRQDVAKSLDADEGDVLDALKMLKAGGVITYLVDGEGLLSIERL
jgi:GTP cyclohydrolase II